MESILRTRHSARKFLDKPVDEKLIREIIADAQRAPSWCNSQPWKAYVVTGDAAKKMVETHHNNVVNQAKAWADVVPPQFTDESWTQAEWKNMRAFWEAADVDADPHAEVGDRLGLMDECTWDFHSPAIVYITIPKISTMFQAYDAGAFGYGITLAAHERGLSCIPAYEFVRYPQEIRPVFDIPEDEAIFMGIGMGYADMDKEINHLHEDKRNDRVPTDEILQILK